MKKNFSKCVYNQPFCRTIKNDSRFYYRYMMNSDHLLLIKIYEHRADIIRYLIRSKNCDQERAETIFADSALTLRKRSLEGSLGEIRDLKAYLTGVCNMFWKKQVAYEQKLRKSVSNIEYYFYEHFAEGPFDLETVDNAKERLLKALNGAFDKLGNKCRILLKLFYYEKKSMTEIADSLGFNNQAVAAATKYRCFKKLRQQAIKLRDELERKEL